MRLFQLCLLTIMCCGSKYIEFGSGSRVMLSILKEKSKLILEKNFFLLKSIFFLTFRTKCHLKKCLISWVSELWIYILNIPLFASILSFIHMCRSGSIFGIRIRIHKATEYWIHITSVLLITGTLLYPVPPLRYSILCLSGSVEMPSAKLTTP